MKISLLNPPYFPHFSRGGRWQDTGRGGTLYYPIWLAYAAALLGQEHEIDLIDAPARGWSRDDVVRYISWSDPGMTVIDSSFPSLKNDCAVAGAVREACPGTKTVLVGPPASQLPDRILEEGGVDIVARFEYDFTLRELARTVEKGEDLRPVRGISYRTDGTTVHNPDREFSSSEDLDEIPFVSEVYDQHLNIEDYFLGQSLYPEVQILTGRGCPNQCTFCAWPQTLTGRKYRVRSISGVLDELSWIEENLAVREVFFEDDTFTIHSQRVLDFCREYQERGLTIPWSCNARANTLDLRTMQEMKRAHCRLLITGYESGDDEILRRVKKGITTDQIRAFARNARKAGLMVHGDFIIGLPGETKASIARTRDLIRETRPEVLQVAVASPFPGTAFYAWCREQGYLLYEDSDGYLDAHGHQRAVISYPDLSGEQMVEEANALLRGYYLSPRYVPLVLRQILRRDGTEEAKRIWHSAKMFLGYLHLGRKM
ncbi:radical SAM protein [Methanofollis aquaemaris]|uniref:Radical SAM protein n=1 Tax=Methanofollis aquaemaris TaxID=126734 RepID=A0A8A3S6X6_9EURY|nr:radical SAM protein [Methanofollis aquaemaris]QSZ67895.1 radical SAM protein [Methanofollis aquaemaris]